MEIVESFLTKNPCYTAGRKITVKGLMLHSVGCNQPKASVFLNSWNSASFDRACVHGFIDGNDGTVYQTLPWNHRGWHAGGTANNTHIGVEMCEPACIKYTSSAAFTCSNVTEAKVVAKRTYDAAVELFAMLCQKYHLNPLADGVILSHKEGCVRGVASNHGDPEHLWRQLGMTYTMDTFRKAVKAQMGGSAAQPTQSTDERHIWDFLMDKLGNAYGVAGLMGNLYAESALRPNNLQNTYEKSLGMTDAQYTAAVDNGSYTNFVHDSAGYGLAQWTYYSRKQNLLNYARSVGKSIGDLDMQLGFLWKELQSYGAVLNTLKNAVSVLEASNMVLCQYERPVDQGQTVQKTRCAYGQAFYEKFSGKTAESSPTEELPVVPFEPYRVRVSIPNLNIRRGPGTNYARTGYFTGKGVFTIVEVKSGTGSDSGWGRLKSGAGWISLDYTKRA